MKLNEYTCNKLKVGQLRTHTTSRGLALLPTSMAVNTKVPTKNNLENAGQQHDIFHVKTNNKSFDNKSQNTQNRPEVGVLQPMPQPH